MWLHAVTLIAIVISAVTAALGILGCAGTDVTPIPLGADESSIDGIRYYEPAPFILVYSDGKGGLTTKLLYLPDTTRKMAIDPYAYLATNKTTLTFTNGMLVQGKSVVDETIVPKGFIEAARSAAAAATKAGAFDDPTQKRTEVTGKVPAPVLYRIIVQKDRVRLIGGYGLNPDGSSRQDINVTISQPAKTDDSKPAKTDDSKTKDAGAEGGKKQ